MTFTSMKNKYSYYSVQEAIKKFGLREVINHPSRWYGLEDDTVDIIFLVFQFPQASLTCFRDYKGSIVSEMRCLRTECIKHGRNSYIFSDSTKNEILRLKNEGMKLVAPYEGRGWRYYKPKNFLYRHEEV